MRTTLAPMLDRKLLLVSGKGGVGKSAVTASLARLAARRGKKVLAVGLTDDIGLAVHFGVERLTYKPRKVHAGVEAMVIDRALAFDEYVRLQIRATRAIPMGQFNKIFKVLVDTAPGIREIITIGKPIHDVWRGDHDLVIVDAPPLGQLISYLRAPATVASIVPSGVIQDQAVAMRATLTDPDSAGLLLVTLAEELPVVETIEALHDMGDEPLVDVIGIVVNRVIDPLDVDAHVIADLDDGPMRDAATHHQRLAEEQGAWLERLPEGPRLPHLFGVLTPGEVAAALVDRWEDA